MNVVMKLFFVWVTLFFHVSSEAAIRGHDVLGEEEKIRTIERISEFQFVRMSWDAGEPFFIWRNATGEEFHDWPGEILDKIHQQGPRNIIAITDLEPDDRIALSLLAAHFGPRIRLVGTTVLHSQRKQILTQRLLSQLGLSHVPVLAGAGGEMSDYEDIASSAAARHYQNEGQGLIPDHALQDLERSDRGSDALYKRIRTLLENAKGRDLKYEFYLFAPPTDLVRVLQQNTELASTIGHIHFMGGWVEDKEGNLRTTYNWNMDPRAARDLLREYIPMTIYSSHMIKPSFGGGSIQESNYPSIIRAIEQSSLEAMADFKKAGKSWDTHLMERIPPLKTIIGEENAGRQFTPADPIMVAANAAPEIITKSRTVRIDIDTRDLDAKSGFRVRVEDAEHSTITLVEAVVPEIFERETLAGLALLEEKAAAAPYSSVENDGLKTVYLTDVEGDWTRFASFFEFNPAFKTGDLSKLGAGITLNPGYRFVFGGDTIDHGPFSRRILRRLLDLKAQHGNRVVLLLGNRDLNKLRFLSEIDLNNLAAFKKKLRKEFGAGDLFEHRRLELQYETGRTEISDREVAESFLEDLEPENGLLAGYLQKAQVAYFDKHHGTYYTHGAVREEAIGAIPGENKETHLIPWLVRLNAWARQLISYSFKMGTMHSTLKQYQEGIDATHVNDKSVIYGRYSDDTANPQLVSKEVQDWYNSQGVHTHISGHTPMGVVPVIIAGDNFRQILADTSSGIQGSVKSPQIFIEGKQVRMTTPHSNMIHNVGENTPLGTTTDDGYRVVAPAGMKWLAIKVDPKTFRIDYRTVELEASPISVCARALTE